MPTIAGRQDGARKELQEGRGPGKAHRGALEDERAGYRRAGTEGGAKPKGLGIREPLLPEAIPAS